MRWHVLMRVVVRQSTFDAMCNDPEDRERVRFTPEEITEYSETDLPGDAQVWSTALAGLSYQPVCGGNGNEGVFESRPAA